MLNKANLIGRWVKDFELKYSQSGVAVGANTLAVDRRRTKEGKRETDFLPVVILGKLAENCSNYSGKGRLVSVSGSVQTRSYQDRQGQKRYVTEILADEVHFLDFKESSNNSDNNGSSAPQEYQYQYHHEDLYPVDIEEDELPF